MMYGLSQSERKEMKALSDELFAGFPMVVFTPEMDKKKVDRYKHLAQKKMELMQASMN